MFCFRKAFLNIRRHKQKGALIVLICALIVLFVSVYINNIDQSERQLANLPQAVTVSARVCNTTGTQVAGLVISSKVVAGIESSGLVKDLVYTAPLAANPADMPDEKNKYKEINICCVNDAKAIPGYIDRTITMMDGVDESIMQGEDAVCIADEAYLESNSVSIGDTVELAVYALKYNSEDWSFSFKPLGTQDIRIVGSMSAAVTNRETETNLVCPVGWSKALNKKADEHFYLDSVFFNVADPLNLNTFKTAMDDLFLIPAIPTAEETLSGGALSVRDQTFISTANSLKNNIKTLYAFAPIVFIVIALVGYVISYLLMQSRRTDIVVMRSLGTSRLACVTIMLIEFAVLGLAGSLLGIAISALLIGFAGIGTPLISMLFFLSFVLGIVAAAVQISRRNLMTGLNKTEE